jgi:myo-inositol-1(or 4)-monophosphatase
MTQAELNRVSAFARELAMKAGALVKRGFNQRLDVQYKGRINPVTQIDLASEKLISGAIAKKFPGHAVLGEEGSDSRGTSDFVWIVDPLDGTVNFAHGFPVYCVSIGVEYQGEVVAGAVYDPERSELFWAEKGRGAWLNKSRIHVSKETRLDRALLATGFAYDIGSAKKNNLGYFARMAKKAQGVRRPGSAAIDLCWLAAGRIDGFWELKLHPWDTAAASLIVAEAGGQLSRVNGSTYSIFSPDLLASNGHLHRAMKQALHAR